MHDGSLATAVQIAKVIREQHDVYERCERISLVSSFSASFFLGHYAPIDHSDGSGMNLMNIHTRQWDPAILRFVAGNNTDDTEYVARRERGREREREPSSNRCTDEPPSNDGRAQRLHEKLHDPVPSYQALGTIATALVDRFGFSPECVIFPGAGDNPNSLAGCCLHQVRSSSRVARATCSRRTHDTRRLVRTSRETFA